MRALSKYMAFSEHNLVKTGEKADEEREFSSPPQETIDELNSWRDSAVGRKESAERLFQQALDQIDRLREEMEEKKNGILRRILEFKRIREIRAEMGFQQRGADRHAKEKEEMELLITHVDTLIEDRKRFDTIVDEAFADNEAFDRDEQEKALEEERKRDVTELAKEHGAYFTHDFITSENKPSNVNHAVETDRLTLDEQADIVIALAPSIAVSTIHPGTRERMFNDEFSKRGSGFGCFLSGGRVQAGRPLDMGSVGVSLRERVVNRDDVQSTKNISDAISKTFDDVEGPRYRDENTSYNELIVQDSEVAGIYFKWEVGNGMQGELADNAEISLQNGNGVRYDSWWDTIATFESGSAPLFVLDRGNNTARLVYDIDFDRRTFKVTPVIAPDAMVSMPGIYRRHTDEGERRKAVMRVFDKVSGALSDEEKERYVSDEFESERLAA